MRYAKIVFKIVFGALLLLIALGGVVSFFDTYSGPVNVDPMVLVLDMALPLLIGWGGVALIRSGVRQGRKSTPTTPHPSA